MIHVWYNLCLSDLYMFIKYEFDIDVYSYYSYILWYVDDILIIHYDTMTMLKKIDKYFKLKPDSIGDPNTYLGSKLRCHRTNNGMYAL